MSQSNYKCRKRKSQFSVRPDDFLPTFLQPDVASCNKKAITVLRIMISEIDERRKLFINMDHVFRWRQHGDGIGRCINSFLWSDWGKKTETLLCYNPTVQKWPYRWKCYVYILLAEICGISCYYIIIIIIIIIR